MSTRAHRRWPSSATSALASPALLRVPIMFAVPRGDIRCTQHLTWTLRVPRSPPLSPSLSPRRWRRSRRRSVPSVSGGCAGSSRSCVVPLHRSIRHQRQLRRASQLCRFAAVSSPSSSILETSHSHCHVGPCGTHWSANQGPGPTCDPLPLFFLLYFNSIVYFFSGNGIFPIWESPFLDISNCGNCHFCL